MLKSSQGLCCSDRRFWPCGLIAHALVKAIARAFRWREMLENGIHATIAEIAAAEKIDESYVGRVLRLTLLAPDIVEAVLHGRHPEQMTVAVLMRRFPVLWSAQRSALERSLKLADQSRSSIDRTSSPF
jgi:hypothetical protein